MKRPIALVIIIVALLIGIVTGYTLYNQGFESLAAQEADLTVSPAVLFDAFNTNEAAANEAYLNKVIEINGTLAGPPQLQDSSAVLVISVPDEAFGISCSLAPSELEKVQTLNTGDALRIRGLCTGFLMDVNLVRCVIL